MYDTDKVQINLVVLINGIITSLWTNVTRLQIQATTSPLHKVSYKSLCVNISDSESCSLSWVLVIHALQYLLFPRGYFSKHRKGTGLTLSCILLPFYALYRIFKC